MDLLRRKGIRATFFCIDEHLSEATAPIVARMFEAGHAVAQHSGNRWLLLRSADALSAELRAAADRMQLLTGHRPCRLFPINRLNCQAFNSSAKFNDTLPI